MAGLAVVGLVVYLAVVGLDKADKLGSAAGVVVAIIGLLAPYLLPLRPQQLSETGPVVAGSQPVPPGGIDLSASKGAQVNLGGTNTQHNSFGSR
ncbi:hypothetical protein FHU28_002382 [Micromonospora echinospora]|uniref:Uncharacterized protein n=1 Tax=Micromonospora echinospora TaxID=1877 RepID=A0ABR6MAZ2_MICEC|nr:hypothetical protein [Micromonospora echinospora]MBB5112543.1 hypothetical protein [Micromonospora echinospora]